MPAPKRETPKRETPKRETSKGAGPKRDNPKRTTVQREAPKRAQLKPDPTKRDGIVSARSTAFRILQRIDHEGAYANLVLQAWLDRSKLDERDRAFTTELVYGTTRMRRACDFAVDRFITSPPAPAVRTLLRLGAYQILDGRVPAHAAVSETVGLAPKPARGFVNAVLRRVAAEPPQWPSEAVRLSYPDWIVGRLTSELGETDAMAALVRMNEAPPVHTRDDGYVQDLGSQLVTDAIGALAGETVLDVCAAPGGKATGMAAAGAFVVAADSRESRVGLIAENIISTGTDVVAITADGTNPPWRPLSFDRVLVDAPCSGLGTLRRRADARWRIEPGDVPQLAALQRQLLDASAQLVRPGGSLVYSVCTLTAEESIHHPVPAGLMLDETELPAPWRRYEQGWRLLPQDADTDGMVVVRYRRGR